MVALPGFIQKWFDNSAREIAKYRAIAEKINALEPTVSGYSDEQIKEKAQSLRRKVQADYAEKLAAVGDAWDDLSDMRRREEDRKIYDPILDGVLPEAFALVREASKRTIGLRHYDVQFIGGMVLHDGRIAEMRTGEGKTLVATAPLFLNALLGKGAHLVTSNDYLSKRDAVWNGPIYHFLGMSVGIIQGQSPETGDEGGSYIYDPDYGDSSDERHEYARPCTRGEAYQCDITYGTNNEYGFDYLRDNMAFSKDDLVQRDLHFAIVDEVDSILIDEARTPLIISGMVEQNTDKYDLIDKIVRQMQGGVDDPKKDKDNPDADKHKPNIHYVVDEKAKTATITDAGVGFVEEKLHSMGIVQGDVNLSENGEIMHYLSASLKAHGVFRKDTDYVVVDTDPNDDKGPEIIIVDENTGRMMFGRRYSDGLHQAIEAKEQVEVQNESQTLATITFQNYFRLYSKLGGMTGTAKTEEDEFRKIYALDVMQVPTNKPIQRKDAADLIYKNEEHKLRGIVAEVLRVYAKEQPILVGTRSIEMSERLSRRFSPQMLTLLTMIEVARSKMEASKSLSKERKAEMTATLNAAMEARRNRETGETTPAVNMGKLRPILKELGISDKPLEPENLNEIAKIFEVPDNGLERLADALDHGIAHSVLNAKFHEKEAIIIAEAGRKGAVTIATNMAGRGVDILLGGKHIHQELPPVDGSDRSVLALAVPADVDDGTDAADAAQAARPDDADYRRFGRPDVLAAVTSGDLTDEEHRAAGNEVRALGGLYILGTERHESRRIDNQLRGRAGRQGDPGESKFFVSMEDELMRLFGDRANSPLLRTWEEHLMMDMPLLSKMIERAQKKVEEYYFESRKNVLNYDDVMNRQRELIYKERRKILSGVNLRDTILTYAEQTVEAAIVVHCPVDVVSAEWDTDGLYEELNGIFLLDPAILPEELNGKSREQLSEMLVAHVRNVYEAKETDLEANQGEGTMRELERWLALRAVNNRWMEHLANMDYLREGIGLRGYEQKDPLLIYQKEAFDEFERMQQSIQDDIVQNVFHTQVAMEPMPSLEFDDLPPQGMPLIQLPTFSIEGEGELETAQLTSSRKPALAAKGGKVDTEAPADWKGGRNDPCWCGSGQKYKKCHGK